MSDLEITLKPTSRNLTKDAYILITFPPTVGLMSILPCALKVNTTQSMSIYSLCLIVQNQIQIESVFQLGGYNPAKDGPIAFSMRNPIANTESNSLYGLFKVEIFDNYASVPSVSGIFNSS